MKLRVIVNQAFLKAKKIRDICIKTHSTNTVCSQCTGIKAQRGKFLLSRARI
jgi:hypothetical protein